MISVITVAQEHSGKRICLQMQEMQVQFMGQEDPLKQEMATHSSILAWKIPWTEEPGKLQSMGSQRVGHDWAHSTQDLFPFILNIYAFVSVCMCMEVGGYAYLI